MFHKHKKVVSTIKDNENVVTLEKEEIDMDIVQHIIDIKETVASIEAKVEIHNNYEQRFKDLDVEMDKLKAAYYKVIAIYSAITAAIGTILFIASKLIN